MADFFKRRDVQALLKHRKIVFIGDSNVRPVYKDLISALKQKELISVEILKNPNVESYCGDIAIQQCGRKHEWTFWENRLFEEGPWRVEMFCTGGLMMKEIQQYIFKLPEVPLSMPDVVYVSFNFSYGKNTHSLLSMLLVNLKMKLPCNTLVIVGSSFPTTKDMFGDPRIDEVPFFTMGSLSRDDGTEEEVIGKVSSLGMHYLNIRHYLRKNVFRGMTTEPGWESVIVRYTTFLLLTYIANSLLIKTPNRVNQDVLRKAILSGDDERELYNNLLLKHANDWLSVKSNALTEEMDLAASNAYEITQMLWKIYHRSRGNSSLKQTLGSKNKRHHRKEINERGSTKKAEVSSLKPRSSKGEKVAEGRRRNTAATSIASTSCSVSPIGVDGPRQSMGQQKNDTDEQECASENVLPVAHEKPIAPEDSSQTKHSPPAGGQGDKNANNDAQDDKSVHEDEVSLEEGEIRESPSGSPKWQTCIRADSNIIDILASDTSSSEGELDTHNTSPAGFDRVVLPGVVSYHQYYQHHPAFSNRYQNYYSQNYQIQQVPTYSAATQQIHCTDLTSNEPADTIEVSDEEPTQDEKPNDECNEADEVIINLNSDEESEDSTSSQNERIEPLRPFPEQQRQEERQYKYHGGKHKLCLMNAEKTWISWPTAIARSGSEILWRWWRRHIESNNGSLVLFYPGMEQIHGAIPSFIAKKGTYIAVPKIVDDMHVFLKSLGVNKFPDYCTNLNVNNANETCRNSNKKLVKPSKLLPLAEELSRGSVKRINFEISKKKISSLTASNRITIKEFASIRNLTAKNIKQSDLDIPREPKASSSSNFYSYGEQMSSVSMLLSGKPHASPLGPWITISKADSEERKTKSTQISSKDKFSIKPPKTKEIPSQSVCKLDKKSSSKQAKVVRKRRRDGSSSSSDRSLHRWRRDRSLSSSDRSLHRWRRDKSLSSSDRSLHRRRQDRSLSSSDRSLHRRRLDRSSSSSDQSLLRDRSPFERCWHRDLSSTERSRYQDWSPSDRYQYRDRSPSDRSRSQGSSPLRRKRESQHCR